MQTEKSLSDFILRFGVPVDEFNQSIVNSIVNRIPLSRRSSNYDLNALLRDAYFEEIFQLAVNIPVQHGLELELKEAFALARSLGLFDIRNKSFHSGHSFPETYWYRVSAFVTDDKFRVLKLDLVEREFRKAQEGTLIDLPDEWLARFALMAPNNLPEPTHSLTGLIGRNAEIKDLRKRISSTKSSLVAVVGPGGLGKTALIIETLDKMINESQFDYAAVVFLTMKTHELTSTGKKELKDGTKVDDIEEDIVNRYISVLKEGADDEMKLENIGGKKILLVLDNLEDLIVKNPSMFEDIYDRVPDSWKVLVTSRIPVASASTIALKPLSDDDAKQLARVYATRRGIAIRPDQIQAIGTQLQNNPLAIRLSVDAFALGKDLDTSIDQITGDIADYSYANIVSLLSKNEMLCLEFLFSEDTATREDISEGLHIDLDDISTAIGQLLRTSLIERTGDLADGEAISLSPGVRDLILANKDNIQIRNQVINRIKEVKSATNDVDKGQNAKRINQYSWAYLHKDIPSKVRVGLWREFPTLVKQTSAPTDLVAVKRRLEAFRSENADLAEPCAYLAMTFSRLDDIREAVRSSGEAVEKSQGELRYLRLKAQIYGKFKQHSEAAEVNAEIVGREEFPSMIGDDYPSAESIVFSLFLSLIYSGGLEEVLARTEDWASGGFLRVAGSMRAWALKRLSEPMDRYDALHNLAMSVEILERCMVDKDSKNHITETVSRNVIESIVYHAEMSRIEDQHMFPRLFSFVENYIVNSHTRHEDRLPEAMKLIDRLRQIALEPNPFLGPKWSRLLNGDSEQVAPVTEGAEPVKTVVVYNVYRPPNGAVFANDLRSVQYYCKKQAANPGDQELWALLKVGSQLDILESSEAPPGKAVPVERLTIRKL